MLDGACVRLAGVFGFHITPQIACHIRYPVVMAANRGRGPQRPAGIADGWVPGTGRRGGTHATDGREDRGIARRARPDGRRRMGDRSKPVGTVTRLLPLPIEQVYAAISDPSTYPHWLIGAGDIRSIDDDWPAKGSCFHHRVGLVGPLKVADTTKVLAIDAPTMLKLEVRARPLVQAIATFQLTASGGSMPPSTRVSITEEPTGPYVALRPVIGPLTDRRNERSLADLEDHLQTGQSHRAPG
jgi:uncharacterized protein YndB with AHSA1/START domain